MINVYFKRNDVLNKTTYITVYQKAFYFINLYFIGPPCGLIAVLVRLGIGAIKLRYRYIDVALHYFVNWSHRPF